MRNVLKATTLENRFPLLAVEEGCILSKDADITVVFRVELPELYTVTSAEYASIHSSWVKAIKVLPTYSVVHKQDWFVKEGYRPDLQKEEMSFLSRSFERHFSERPFLNHACYLFLTKTTKNRNRQQSNFSTLCRGHIIPKEVQRYCPQVPRSDRAIRADYERKRFYSPLSPDGRGDYRDGGDTGTD